MPIVLGYFSDRPVDVVDVILRVKFVDRYEHELPEKPLSVRAVPLLVLEPTPAARSVEGAVGRSVRDLVSQRLVEVERFLDVAGACGYPLC